MKYKQQLTGLLCLLPMVGATAQEKIQWSLQDCIDHAMTHNISLKRNRLTEQQGEADLEQKRAALFPSLSLSTTQSLNYRPLQETASNIVTNGIANNSTNKLTENGSYGLNAQWTVWDGGADRKSIRAQKIENQVSALATRQAANSIQEQIARLYVQILYTKDALQVNEAMLETARKQEERGQELYDQGLISKTDLSQLKSQRAAADYDCVATRTQIANYTRQLKELLEITDGRTFDIAPLERADEKVTAAMPALDEVYQNALNQRPEIQSQLLSIQAAEVNIDVARAGYFPTIAITAGVGDSHYSGSRESVGEQMKQNLNASAGVTLSIPIFDNKRTRTGVKKARLTKQDSELALQDKQKQLYATVEECWLNACSSQQKFVAADVKVQSAKDSYELLDEQFKNGLKNIVELMTGRDQLISAQQDRLQSKYDALLNLQLLRFYEGEELQM
ncbi:MAG: TolC family protein [Clostridium sp.]|nr:TolC family protein [Clostridium sp.]